MSTEIKEQQPDLTHLVKRAIAKDRQAFLVSLVVTTLLLAGGLAWIAYASNRVAKLKQTEAELITRIAQLKSEIESNRKTLLSAEANIAYAKTTVEQGESKEEHKMVLQALSTVQQTVKEAIDEPAADTNPTTPDTPKTSAIVPNLKGVTLETAAQMVRDAGLTPEKIDQEGNGTPNTVLYQDPLPGRSIPVNDSVKLYVIPALAEIPNLKGMMLDEATRTVRGAKLKFVVIQQEGRRPPGTILYQDPLPRKYVKVGTEIKLYVNR